MCVHPPADTIKLFSLYVLIVWVFTIALAAVVYAAIEKPGIDARAVLKRSGTPKDPADSGDVLIMFQPALNLYEMLELSIGLSKVRVDMLFCGAESEATPHSYAFLELQPTNDNRLPSYELLAAYEEFAHLGLDVSNLEFVLQQEFFYVDSGKHHFDFAKIQLFNILYCGGELEDKVDQLFKVLRSPQSGYIIDESH